MISSLYSWFLAAAPALLFWFFSALMLGFGLSVIFNRNPVASALSLVCSFISMAALFVLLNAYFLAVIQVLVYAGAVMMLFLFIIMLLDIKAETDRRITLPVLLGGTAIAALFVGQLVAVLRRFPMGNEPFAPLTARLNDAHNIGMTLFSAYNLPFQVAGVLILVAAIGVVVLSQRELK